MCNEVTRRKVFCGTIQYQNIYREVFVMIYVGIDVAKDKHDCFIISSDGEVLFDVFTIQNNIEGFESLLLKIKTVEKIRKK